MSPVSQYLVFIFFCSFQELSDVRVQCFNGSRKGINLEKMLVIKYS